VGSGGDGRGGELGVEVGPLLGEHGAPNVRVFGSVARDEATEASDVDLLIDVAPGTGLFAGVKIPTHPRCQRA
jgi:predicted nucleotidyltransferase